MQEGVDELYESKQDLTESELPLKMELNTIASSNLIAFLTSRV